MYCVRQVTDKVYWVGANERRLQLFENLFPIPNGVSYNSYLVLDEKTCLLDTVDQSVSEQFFENIAFVLNNRTLDYLIINHMEPDHCANIERIVRLYPQIKLVMNAKVLALLKAFFTFALPEWVDKHVVLVKEGSQLSIGETSFTFVMAPMVHWPEVMVTYDNLRGILYCADAFGAFGALNGNLFNDEFDIVGEWSSEYRRYYSNIVGKYGIPVRTLLKKAASLELKMLCPLHGPIWRSSLSWPMQKYTQWSNYQPEENGVLIVYASMYGHLENVANVFANMLGQSGQHQIKVYDVSKTDVSYLVSEAFRLSHLVVIAPTYNANLYPRMEHFLNDLKALNLSNRDLVLLEGGSWAPQAGKRMREIVESMSQMRVADTMTIHSSLKDSDFESLVRLQNSLLATMPAK